MPLIATVAACGAIILINLFIFLAIHYQAFTTSTKKCY